jgi:2,4-dienoyl-CoA reductase-like NADH-dependent reductase (Old Yellow Enzyme family)
MPCPAPVRAYTANVKIMSRADYESFVAHFFHLCTYIGINPACRALGIKESRGRQIASRRKFGISKIRADALHPNALKSRDVTGGIEATKNIIAHYSDRARVGAVISGAKVFEHLADKEPNQLIGPATAIAADQWAKVTDRAAGWSAERAQGVTVQVANLVMPTPEQRAERRALHDKLDEIAKQLKQPIDQ